MSGGGLMDRHLLAEIALRYDTLMSRAMLRALGITRSVVARAVTRTGSEGRRYVGMAWCFANHGSPMDVR